MDLQIVSRTDYAADHGDPDPQLSSYYVVAGDKLIGEFETEAEAVAYIAQVEANAKAAKAKAGPKAEK